jgi:hypothetical protein
MKKKSSPPRLPPLSLEALSRVEKIEHAVSSTIQQCSDPVRMMSNQPRLSRVFRTCVVELLSVQFAYYDSLPTYHPDWELEIAQGTVDSLLGLFPLFIPPAPYRPELVRTVNEYLRERFEQSQIAPQGTKQVSRKELRGSYLAAFPEVKILDICWAADQHYREWKRWLNDELKDSSTPDLAFRRVLTSGKRPAELKKRPRPSGWQ